MSRGNQFIICVLLFCIAIFSCGKVVTDGNGGGGGEGDTDACGGSTKGCILGNVVDAETGGIVADVIVSVGGVAPASSISKAVGTVVATANSQGWYSASGIDEGDAVTLCYQCTNYVSTCHDFTIVGGKTTNIPPIQMTQKATSLQIDNIEAGGTVADVDTGAELTIGAGTACAADGTTPAVGTVTCSLTILSSIDAAPGSFTGVRLTSSQVSVMSGGMLNISCEDASGSDVTLCASSTSEVKIPVLGPSECATLNDPMQSWSLDDGRAVWSEYSIFNRNCGSTDTTKYFYGTINRWGWWNAARPADFTCLTGTVTASSGDDPNELAFVYCDLSEESGGTERARNSTQSDSEGNFCVLVARATSYDCNARKGQFRSFAKTGDVPDNSLACGDAGCEDIGDFNLEDPILQTTLTWGAESSAVPRDLDSHFISMDGSIQIYFGNKDAILDVSKGSLTGAPFIELDTDDVNWKGPENVTVVPGIYPGIYRFCVDNFSGDGDLTTSEAQVIASGPGSGLPKLYTVPTSPFGKDVWQVYEVTIGEDGSISITNLDSLVTGDDVAQACLQ
ncbi:MAG: hypothetical protein ABH871_04295 [Pseudomonadota bacterium]